MSKEILQVNDLKKYFDTPAGKLHAVDGVSFSIEEGKTLGVVGESGCGKSTLGRVIINLLPATSGQVVFDGQNIVDLPKKQMSQLRREMQIIFQDPFSSLNPRMTVQSIIKEPMQIYNIYGSEEEMEQNVLNLMDTVGLARRLRNAYPHELDGGRRQRIGIARALALNPKFIVCDEPVSALDVSIQAQILNLMQDLQEAKNLTYLFITHNLSVVRHISDNILVMYLGKIVEFCDAKELFIHPQHPYTKALLSAIPVANIHRKKEKILLKGEISSPIEPKARCRFAGRCPIATEVCFACEPETVEVSPKHYVACHNLS